MIVILLPQWVIKAIEKFMKGFVWRGTSEVIGGQCVVAWQKVSRPVDMGGLGIPNLTYQGHALRLRWEWLRRTDDSRSWLALPDTPDRVVQQLLSISVHAQVGDGTRTLFWCDKWLQGESIEQLAPHAFNGVQPRMRKSRTVHDALQNDTWIQDVTGARTFPLIREFLQLWDRLQMITITEGMQDKLIWRWSASGVYSSSSAYRIFFMSQYSIAGAKELSKTRAPAKAKFFIWLALLGRCWTSDRLQRHRLQNSGPCALCAQATESIDHLLLGCAFSREVWFKLLCTSGHQALTPSADQVLVDWWLLARKRIAKQQRKGFDCLFVLACWELWKVRNRRVFQQIQKQPIEVVRWIKDEGNNWVQAGYRSLLDFIQ